LALHSPLEIKERHHHSFDPFPDENRVLPFGRGASIFYNYVDLRFINPTQHNEIWRRVIDKRTGKTLEEQLMIHNYSEVKYEIIDQKERIQDV
jgi:vancomycin resistance protein VanW